MTSPTVPEERLSEANARLLRSQPYGARWPLYEKEMNTLLNAARAEGLASPAAGVGGELREKVALESLIDAVMNAIRLADGTGHSGFMRAVDAVLALIGDGGSDSTLGNRQRVDEGTLPSPTWRTIDSAPHGQLLLLYGDLSPPFTEDEGLYPRGPIHVVGYWDEIDGAWALSSTTWTGPFFEPTHWSRFIPANSNGAREAASTTDLSRAPRDEHNPNPQPPKEGK